MTATFARWYAAGFADIIPVVPPDAPLSPHSKIRAADRGKVPGLLGQQGWRSFDWMKHATKPADVEVWDYIRANTGLRATRFPGVDLDCLDGLAAELAHTIAVRRLGPAPIRTGRAPKKLLPYRLAEGQPPLTRRRVWFKSPNGGPQNLVEFLGHGQQYVVDGIHPATGRPYTWDRHPADMGPDGLSPITAAMVDDFFGELLETLDLMGYERIEDEGRGAAATERDLIDQSALAAPDLDTVAEIVRATPNDNDSFPGRTDYIRMGCAIKAACADDEDRGLEIFAEWASRWEGNDRAAGNDPDEVRSDWDRMKPPFEVGFRYLVDMAAQHGGYQAAGLDFEPIAPDAAEDFGQVPDEAPPKRYAPMPEQIPEDFDPTTIPPRPWVLGSRFLRGVVTGGIGAPGVSKSTMSLLSALAIATGRDLTGEHVFVTGPVWVHNHEDDRDEILRRVAGMCRRYEIPFAEIRPRFFFSTGAVKRLVVAVKKDDAVLQTKAVAEIVETIRAHGIVFLAVDPFVSTHEGVAENSNEEVERVISAFRDIARETGCAIDLVHHSVKNHSGNTESRAGDMNAARGAGALIGAVRVAYTLAAMSEQSAEKLKVPEEDAARLVRLDGAKGNYAARSFKPTWFRMESVDLGNGSGGLLDPSDSVGVPVLFDMDAHAAAVAASGDDEADQDAQQVYADAQAIVALMPLRRRVKQKDLVDLLARQLGCKATVARDRILAAALDGDEGQRRIVEVQGQSYALYRIRESKSNPYSGAWIVCDPVGAEADFGPLDPSDEAAQ